MAASVLAASLTAQAGTPPTTTESRRDRFFHMDSVSIQSDTVMFTTNVGGNYSYGRNDNALFRWDNAVVMRMHRRLVSRIGTEYGIGLATNDEGTRYMDRRWWRVSGTADLDPFRRVSPFALATMESVYELRIDRRTTAGVGAKLTVFRRQADTVGQTAAARALPTVPNRLDVSLAVTAEQNLLPRIDRSALPSEALARNLTRLSGRLRWTQRLGARWWFDQTTWFKPELLALHRYNAELSSKLQYALTRRTQFTISSRHVYEGSASGRGAKNNRVGSVDVGVTVNLGARPR